MNWRNIKMKKLIINIIVFILLSSVGFAQKLVMHENIAQKSLAKPLLEEQKSYPICGTSSLIPKEQEIIDYFREHQEERTIRSLAKPAWTFKEGDSWSWWASNFVTNDFYRVASTCRKVGDNCYVFVSDSTWQEGLVDQAGVNAIVDGFDNTTPNFASQGIYDVNTANFGDPPNFDGDDKIIILILNILDDYDGSGAYTAGYFSPGNQLSANDHQYSNEAEMFYVDSYPANLITEGGRNQILDTIAHEFQHMIHHEGDEDEITFPNEGLSEIASYICGYGLRNDSGYRDNTNVPLFNWSEDDALPDYTRAALWTLYLLEQHPNGFLEMLVKAPLNAGDGINQALTTYGATRTWQEIFVDWLIANYLQDTSVDPRWGYAYPNSIASEPFAEHNRANVSGSGSLIRTSGQYVTFNSSIPDTITFNAGSSLNVKAIKIGNNTVVEDVPKDVPYLIKPNGETYSDVTFCIINNSAYTQYNYSYQATGTETPVEPGNYEISYEDGIPEGYLGLDTGDSIAVQFDGIVGGKLDSIKTIFQGSGRIKFDISKITYATNDFLRGEVLLGLKTINIMNPSADWVLTDLTANNIDVSEDFVVSFLMGDDPENPTILLSRELVTGEKHSYVYTEYFVGNTYWDNYGEGNDIYYNFMIRAYISVGGTTTLAQPVITSILANQGNVQLSWNASSGPVEGYNIYRSTSTGFTPNSNNKIGSVGSTVTSYTDALPNIQANTDYFYRISSFDGSNNESDYSDEVTTRTLYVNDNDGIPLEYSLNSNYPNPFNPSTTFRFSTPKNGLVKFTVHDLLGRVIYSESRDLFAGNYSFTWDGQNQLDQQVVSGVYFLRMETEGFVQTRKMLMMK